MRTQTDAGPSSRAFIFMTATSENYISAPSSTSETQSEPDELMVSVSAWTVARSQSLSDVDTMAADDDVSREAARELRKFRQPAVQGSIEQQVSGMQKWEGHVTSVSGDLFCAELWPLGGEAPVVTADFDRSLIAEGDLELLAEGAVFYCTVRTVKGPGGQPYRTSNLRMRRLGVWTEEAVENLMERARERVAALERYTD